MMLREAALALSKEEKYDLMETLRLDLEFEEWKAGEVEIPDWHWQILNEREEAFQRGEDTEIPWEVAWREILESTREIKNEIDRSRQSKA